MKSIRAEIREVVELAQRRSKPIGAQIIWGSLTRDVPESSFRNTISLMCRRGELVTTPAPVGLFKPEGGLVYSPGEKPVTEPKKRERVSGMLGNVAHLRLLDARAAARRWAK